MNDELIDMLRDKTIFGRHSRGEVREFLARLETEGFEIAKKLMLEPEHVPVEMEMPAVQPMPVAESMEPAVVEG